MADRLVAVTVRIPPALAARARELAQSQERTIQVIYARALRVGMEISEDIERAATVSVTTIPGRVTEVGDGAA